MKQTEIVIIGLYLLLFIAAYKLLKNIGLFSSWGFGTDVKTGMESGVITGEKPYQKPTSAKYKTVTLTKEQIVKIAGIIFEEINSFDSDEDVIISQVKITVTKSDFEILNYILKSVYKIDFALFALKHFNDNEKIALSNHVTNLKTQVLK